MYSKSNNANSTWLSSMITSGWTINKPSDTSYKSSVYWITNTSLQYSMESFMCPIENNDINEEAVVTPLYNNASNDTPEVMPIDSVCSEYAGASIANNIFPVVYLKTTTLITDGDGSKTNPYIIE